MSERIYGKHLAQVVDNDDPSGLGRLRVSVPEVFDDATTGWCLPSSPYAGPNYGFAALPPVGALVWVEWPSGDVTRLPVWSGGMWASGQGVPDLGPDVVVLQTAAGHLIKLTDTEGSQTIEIVAASGAAVKLDDDGVELSSGSQKIAITSSSVSINDGALEVS